MTSREKKDDDSGSYSEADKINSRTNDRESTGDFVSPESESCNHADESGGEHHGDVGDGSYQNDSADLACQKKSNLTLTTTPASTDVRTDSHISTIPVQLKSPTQRPVLQKEDIETANGQQQDRIMCVSLRDEDMAGDKDIDADSHEDGKVKVSPTTNLELPPNKYDEYNNNPDVKLAIAVAVPSDDDSGDEFLYGTQKLDVQQVATPAYEYNETNHHNTSFCRRHAGFVGGCSVLSIVVIVLIVVLLLPRGNVNQDAMIDTPSVTMAPTAPPTDSTLESRIMKYLSREVSANVLIEGTSYQMAADWFLNQDLQMLDPDMSDDMRPLLQRYILAVFYFSSTQNGSTPWRSCNPSAGTNSSTCTFLEQQLSPDRSSMTYVEVSGKKHWLSNFNECEWEGVNCGETNYVEYLKLSRQGIKGNLANIFGNSIEDDEDNKFSYEIHRALPFMYYIDLSYNDLRGTLPASLADFSYLQALELQGNSLSGEIPTLYFDKMTSLVLLNVGENGLSGTLDTRIGQLSELQGLHLHENNFRGQLPSEIGNLSFLTHSRVVGNELSGTLPTEFGQLDRLMVYHYSNNQFTGTIPTEFGQLSSIRQFRLDGNQLAGNIPIELCNLTTMQEIMLDRNGLTGLLPTSELLNLQWLVRFQVSNNRLTGPIPSQLGNLPRLRLAWLHLNEFTGAIPTQVCEAANIPNTGLNFLQADCSPIENAPNSCTCCTACCDRSTRICSPVE